MSLLQPLTHFLFENSLERNFRSRQKNLYRELVTNFHCKRVCLVSMKHILSNNVKNKRQLHYTTSMVKARIVGDPLLHDVQIGVSTREDFKLVPQYSAILIIDIQDHLSSTSTSTSTSTSDPSAVDGNIAQDDHESTYLCETSLPRAIPNMAKLVKVMRSIRDGTMNMIPGPGPGPSLSEGQCEDEYKSKYKFLRQSMHGGNACVWRCNHTPRNKY